MGLPLFGVFFAIQSAYVSIGRSGVVLKFIVIGNVLNTALDPIFIFGLSGLPGIGRRAPP